MPLLVLLIFYYERLLGFSRRVIFPLCSVILLIKKAPSEAAIEQRVRSHLNTIVMFTFELKLLTKQRSSRFDAFRLRSTMALAK